MAKFVFIRDTNPNEDDVVHKKGETIELSESSVNRWLRREAIAPYSPPARKPKTSTKKTTKEKSK